MEWLITEQGAWFIFGGIIGYTFMFIIALLAIRRLKSHYKTEIYGLRLKLIRLKKEQSREQHWKKAFDSLTKGYGKETGRIITDELESNEEKE